MKVSIDEACKPAITFDQEGYCTFLRAQGISDAHIDRLTVSLRLPHPAIYRIERRCGAYFRTARTIEVYLWDNTLSSRKPNHTLLHETRHFIQDCQGNGDTHEWSLPYHERPCEIDACSFADQHSPHCIFLEVVDIAVVREKCKERLHTWWTRNDETRGIML